jgi:hypothetical protein
MQLNFHISISGIVTFKNAVALKQVSEAVPLQRLLIETDAPYLLRSVSRQNQRAGLRALRRGGNRRLKGIPIESVARAHYGELLFRLQNSPVGGRRKRVRRYLRPRSERLVGLWIVPEPVLAQSSIHGVVRPGVQRRGQQQSIR